MRFWERSSDFKNRAEAGSDAVCPSQKDDVGLRTGQKQLFSCCFLQGLAYDCHDELRQDSFALVHCAQLRANLFKARISVHLLKPPSSNKFMRLIFPDGLPIITGFQSGSSAPGPHTMLFLLAPKTPFGTTCSSLQRQRTTMQSTVNPRRMAATIAVAVCAPTALVISPDTPVDAAERMKPRPCAAKNPAQMRGKDE